MGAASRNVLSSGCGPVRHSWRNFFFKNLARIFSSSSQNLQKIPGFFFVPFSLSRSLPPPLLACQSSSHSHFVVILYASLPTGKFEDFKALGALLELSIGYCKKIDCKKALEVLPTMPWAAQIQTLDLSGTDVEGTAECSFVFADQCAFLEEISPLRILREFSRVARRTCRNFLEISSLPLYSLAYSHPALPACQSYSTQAISRCWEIARS